MNEERLFTVALSLQKGVGHRTILSLLYEAGDIAKLYKIAKNIVSKKSFPGQNRSIFKNFKRQISDAIKSMSEVEKILSKRKRLKFVCVWESNYPRSLTEIYDPPSVLYYSGNYDSEFFRNCISIVGTRRMTAYGKKWAFDISSSLAETGYTIVSGMATGIDGVSHEGAISIEGGKTIAVLASSADVPNPVSNTRLYRYIMESGGLAVSETFPTHSVVPSQFVRRNRIIAGLSKGTVVIEAGIKSGALITSDVALKENRDVFALPGAVHQKQSEGCNLLIQKSGAKLIQGVEDILIEYSHSKLANVSKSYHTNPKDLSEIAIRVYNLLLECPKSFEEMRLELQLNDATIHESLLELEIEGIIKKNSSTGEYYIN